MNGSEAGVSRLDRLVMRLGNAAENHALEIGDAWNLLQEAHDEIQRLSALSCEPMRVISVAAIREATGCPDLIGKTGEPLSEILMREIREYIHGA